MRICRFRIEYVNDQQSRQSLLALVSLSCIAGRGGDSSARNYVSPYRAPVTEGPSMKALVKSKAEPGIWLEDVPEPSYGIDDVLIRVLKTGI